ncbi:glycoside hydrolase family 32 protein [Cryomorpha ignava]|uniref:Glycoside hydrolase family 32 protein n=1 Tax=Cryomorpha ignava TaxID=101383 RepID=A0A7K3WPJ2_9FLAO|nr:glycoside hydrolase family 32 protein [Cryomorpha ignava]NEN23408.1 glycoside hydrolase family 32 protein [Cryomorpha ignava]
MTSVSYGRIFDPANDLPTGYTHASNPVGIVVPGSESLIRIFFSSRDTSGKSHVFSADYKFENRKFGLLSTSIKPILSPGEPGLFDCDGISVGSVVMDEEVLRLYYVGWQLQKSVPWINTIGLALSDDFGKSFTKSGRVPVMDRSEEDPFSMSYPWVEKVNDRYEMWYGSNLVWGKSKQDMLHVIKRANSVDGKQWVRNSADLFQLTKDMTAMSRPSALRTSDKTILLLSIKDGNNNYGIWQAQTINEIDWDLKKMEIESTGLWDEKSQSYGSFFIFENTVFILYNGNEFGKTGFGVAELELSDRKFTV